MKSISLVNYKGGVGKTTVCIALAACLAEKGKKVLLIDLDPQGTLSKASRADCGEKKQTIYEVLSWTCSLADAIQKTDLGYDICPAPDEHTLRNIAISLLSVPGKEFRLRNALASLPEGMYDYVLIDTQGSLDTLPIISAVGSDYVVIPTEATAFSTGAMADMIKWLNAIKCYNPNLQIAGVLMNKVNGNSKIVDQKTCIEAAADFCKTVGVRFFNAMIHQSAKVSASQLNGVNLITSYSLSKNRSGKDFMEFTDELLEIVK